MTRVLVTDGEQRAALAAVRSLGQAGFEVYTCSHCRPSLAGVSRWSTRSFPVPDPLSERGAFLDAIVSAAEGQGIDVLLPVTEAALRAILPHRERLPGVTIPFPSNEIFARVSDKELVLSEAYAMGIHVPKQVIARGRPKLDSGVLTSLSFPVVVKPSRSVADDGNGGRKGGASYAQDPTELDAMLSRLHATQFPVLMQERIRGPGVGIFVLLWEGELLAHFAHQRIREKPPSGGVSVVRRSVATPQPLLEQSLALLQRLGWQGVAMVEYKVAPDGTAYLMEINPRLWGSLQLAVDAGVNFPSLLVRASTGERIEPVASYRSDVGVRWSWGVVDLLIARLRRPGQFRPAVAGGRLRAMWDLVSDFGPGRRDEVFRWSDLRPFVTEALAGWRGGSS